MTAISSALLPPRVAGGRGDFFMQIIETGGRTNPPARVAHVVSVAPGVPSRTLLSLHCRHYAYLSAVSLHPFYSAFGSDTTFTVGDGADMARIFLQFRRRRFHILHYLNCDLMPLAIDPCPPTSIRPILKLSGTTLARIAMTLELRKNFLVQLVEFAVAKAPVANL